MVIYTLLGSSRVLSVSSTSTPDLEYSALQTLIEHERRATEGGTVIWLVGLNPAVLEMVRHAGMHERLGRERRLFNASEAIHRYQAMQSDVESPTKSVT